MRVLLIEDDPDTAAYIVKGLEEEGHTIDHLSDGRDGMAQAMAEEYDVMIIDRMLPGTEGLAIVKTLRAAGRSRKRGRESIPPPLSPRARAFDAGQRSRPDPRRWHRRAASGAHCACGSRARPARRHLVSERRNRHLK